MKKYNMSCPSCGESRCYISANDPSIIYCYDCGDEVDINCAIRSAIGWVQYALDLNELLVSKNKIFIPEDVKEAVNNRTVELE